MTNQQQAVQAAQTEKQSRPFWQSKFTVPWVYALGVAVAEALVGYENISLGLVVHFILLLALLVQATLAYVRPQAAWAGEKMHRLYLTLTLCPLIRILSLTIPLKGIPFIYWYAVIALPLIVVAFVLIRMNGYSRRDVFLVPGKLPVQAAIALTGIPLGIIENRILQPAPLIPALTLEQLWLPCLIMLIFTGFFEELIFRGVLQKSATDALGDRGALFLVGFLFAVLHITHMSVIDVGFVFGVAVLFYWYVYRTRSILGVTFAHALTNIGLYLVWPFILGKGTGL